MPRPPLPSIVLVLVCSGLAAGCLPDDLPPGSALPDTAQDGAADTAHDADAVGEAGDTVGDAVADTVDAAEVADTAGPDAPADVASPDPEPMIALPAGTFWMGSSAAEITKWGYPQEGPRHPVGIQAFSLDQHEVTVEQYQACVTAGGCSVPQVPPAPTSCTWGVSGKHRHPVNCVTWGQAQAYCQWAGKRLPTEAEWEYAGRSADTADPPRTYPWGGDDPSCDKAIYASGAGKGCGAEGTWPVCSKPGGHSVQGACDLAGNVWEWVADWSGPYIGGAVSDPTGPGSGTERVIRGGSWSAPAEGLRAALRGSVPPDKLALNDIGFRCARRP